MKKFLGKLRGLSAMELFGALEACLWLGGARLLLAIVPFRWVFAGARKISRKGGVACTKSEARVLRARRSLRRAVYRCPFESSCLVQALAGRAMLSIRGIGSELTIGVKGPRFEAHAWLRAGGFPIVGAESSKGFKVLAELK